MADTPMDLSERALARYRERNDGRADCLLEHARHLREHGSRRRSELIEREVERQGMERELADLTYDLAAEEGLDPLLAFALIECGLLIRLEPPAPEAPVVVEREPDWVHPSALVGTEQERRLRLSFRRLRSLLEESDAPESALAAFAAEPDVG
jgi:hypothetical protein